MGRSYVSVNGIILSQNLNQEDQFCSLSFLIIQIFIILDLLRKHQKKKKSFQAFLFHYLDNSAASLSMQFLMIDLSLSSILTKYPSISLCYYLKQSQWLIGSLVITDYFCILRDISIHPKTGGTLTSWAVPTYLHFLLQNVESDLKVKRSLEDARVQLPVGFK